MRAKQFPDGRTLLWLSAADTYEWANRSGARWPGSYLAGSRLYAEFEPNGDLVDCRINGNYDEEMAGYEFNAIASDFLRERFGPDHPAIRD